MFATRDYAGGQGGQQKIHCAHGLTLSALIHCDYSLHVDDTAQSGPRADFDDSFVYAEIEFELHKPFERSDPTSD